jgi:hypothetical protein
MLQSDNKEGFIMKKLFSILGFILLAVLAVSCIEPWEEPAGKFSISFGGGNSSARSLYEDREQLTFTIKLSGGPGADQSVKDIKYGQTVNFSVVPGRWNIYVAAWLEGELKAEHSQSKVIKSGRNDPIKITLDENGNIICDHRWGKWEITEAATCVASGIGSRVCEICNAEETEIPIDPNGHNFGDTVTVTKEATCDEDGEGEEKGTCELCWKETTKTLAKLDHDWGGDWKEITPPTYTTEGVETETCTHNPSHTRGTRPGASRIPITDISTLSTVLTGLETNTTDNPYTINLQTDDITVIKNALNNATSKYVYLDLTGSTITEIPEWAFYDYATDKGCATLVGITIPNGVTTIGEGAFGECTSLTSVTIGSGVTSIGESPFYGCTSHTTINVDADNPNYASEGGILLYNKAKTQIETAAGGISGNVIIPDSVTSIGIGAFQYCTSLTDITIPDSVITIGGSLLAGCTSLASVTIGNSVTSIGDQAFERTSLASVIIPDSVISIGSEAFRGCTSLTSVTIGNSVTSIGVSAFNSCTSVKNITIKTDKVGNDSSTNWTTRFYSATDLVVTFEDVTNIGEYAFYAQNIYPRLISVTIPYGVTTIGRSAFRNCANLASVTIPDSVTSIEMEAFQFCTGLTDITIPNSVTSIGANAFNDCTNLASVTFERNGNTGIYFSSGVFMGNLVTVSGGTGALNRYGTYTTTAPVSSSSVWTKK